MVKDGEDLHGLQKSNLKILVKLFVYSPSDRVEIEIAPLRLASSCGAINMWE